MFGLVWVRRGTGAGVGHLLRLLMPNRRDDVLPEMRRSIELRFRVTPGQAADLRLCAQKWGVPFTTACYGVMAEFISRARHEALKLGNHKFYRVQAASMLMLARMETVDEYEAWGEGPVSPPPECDPDVEDDEGGAAAP